MTNEVLETDTFLEVYDSFEKKEQEWIEKIKDQLKENLLAGKPLGFIWLREKRLDDKRLFYVINEKTEKALLVAFGPKKEQQRIINNILRNKEEYLSFIS